MTVLQGGEEEGECRPVYDSNRKKGNLMKMTPLETETEREIERERERERVRDRERIRDRERVGEMVRKLCESECTCDRGRHRELESWKVSRRGR